MEIHIIKSVDSPFINDCLSSLQLNTEIPYSLYVSDERRSREETLNSILEKSKGVDIIVAADDVVFTCGWDRKLFEYWSGNRLIGFSMVDPKTNLIQNRGYQLVSIDGVVFTDALDCGKSTKSIKSFEYQPCTTVTGCFQAIPKEITQSLREFPLEGRNRWGELLFHIQAQRFGFEVGVLGHLLKHHGKSTKQNNNIELSSESYFFEKKHWQFLAKKYGMSDFVRLRIKRRLECTLRKWLEMPCLIYGAGTITEFLGNHLSFAPHIICSGLKEESGKEINRKKVKYIEEIDFRSIKRALITVSGRYAEIAKVIRQKAPNLPIFRVQIEKQKDTYLYSLATCEEVE
jgi:hypothetical protein